jgi:gamma-glutamyltranspeptidase/glutathione hydrolase
LADADYSPVPVKGLLDAAYGASRARSIAWDEPLAPAAAGTPTGAGTALPGRAEEAPGLSTTHLVVVDPERNVVSLTATIEQAFGSGMVVPGRGFLLNNEMTDFDPRDRDGEGRLLANRVEGGRRPRASALDKNPGAGGKRPRSSMAPTIVLKDGRPVLAVGSPGGPRIIQYVAAVLLRVLEQRVPLQRAIETPHATHLEGTTVLEPELDSPPLRRALERLGHRVAVARQASGLHAVGLDPATGTLTAGIDPRRDGAAAGE